MIIPFIESHHLSEKVNKTLSPSDPHVYSDEYQIVIKALREARIAKGITQGNLALALDRPQSFIAKVENGERRKTAKGSKTSPNLSRRMVPLRMKTGTGDRVIHC